MKTPVSLLCVLALLATITLAQQPNSLQASLTINGHDGPPFPIAMVAIPVATPASLVFSGSPGAPLLLVATESLLTPGLSIPPGVVNISLGALGPGSVILNGFAGPASPFVIGASGNFSAAPPVPLGTQGVQAALQGLVQNPASPAGATLTAASAVTIIQGGLAVPISNTGSDGCQFLDTAGQFGFSIPFYGATWPGCWICANGFVTFGSPNTDFTPTLTEMHMQQPRIAAFWTDLDPTSAQSGPILATIGQANPSAPLLTITFDRVSDWPAGGFTGIAFHDVALALDTNTGTLTIRQYPSNSPSIYDMIVGISPGLGLDPTGAGSTDISATLAAGPFFGQPNEGLYEGFRGLLSITGAFPASAVYDLAGVAWAYHTLTPGQPGAAYVMTAVP